MITLILLTILYFTPAMNTIYCSIKKIPVNWNAMCWLKFIIIITLVAQLILGNYYIIPGILMWSYNLYYSLKENEKSKNK